MTHDDESDSKPRLSRRRYVASAGTLATIGVAGCTGGDSGGDSSGSESGMDESGGTTNELEIVHWWTAGGEKDAYQALLDGFRAEYPEVDVQDNPAPGGAGSAIDAVIQNRVVDGDPPSTFQIWPGQSLTPYTDEGLLDSIGDSVWDDGMRDAYLDGVVDLSRPSGEFVAVPINIHRLNNLFYNVSVIEDAGVDVSSITSPQDLLGAMDTVASETDATPMAHQTQAPWSSLQMWESIFIGEQSVEDYRTLLSGDVASLEGEVRSALETFVGYADYFPEDAGSISWNQGNNQVINGNAGFLHQGDWAAGQYGAAENFEFSDDWDMMPFPGTAGVYHSVIDSFVLPTNNPSPEATTKFLNYAGSVDAQERFNPIKGSIPPRTDVPMDEFGDFISRQFEDFQDSDTQPPTIAHGTAVDPETQSAFSEVFANFNGSLDLNAAVEGIRDAL